MRPRPALPLARLTLALAFAACALPLLRAQAPRPLQPADFAALRDVADPQLSPDGTLVAYTVRTTDLPADKTATHLWLVRWDGTDNRALTHGDTKHSRPRWSPDGRWLAFLSSRRDDREVDQVWLLPRDGGEAEKLTEAPGGVEDFAWSPNSSQLALVVRDLDPREPDPKAKEKKTPPPLVIDRFQFKQDRTGYLTEVRTHLALIELGARKIIPLTSGPHDHAFPVWSPDGRQLAFVSNRDADPDRSENTDVFVMYATPGAVARALTGGPEADAHPDWGTPPAWSPDGTHLAYLRGGDPKLIGFATRTVMLVPAAGGTPRALTPTLDRNPSRLQWAPDGRSLLFALEDDGAQPLLRLAVAADASVAPAAPVPVLGGRRRVNAFTQSASGRLVALTSTPDRPFELFAVEPAGPRPLSRQNDAFLATVRLARVEEISARAADGPEVRAFLVHPLDTPAGSRPPPAILRPHGGPQSQYAAEFSFDAQLFAAHGYSVLLPNPRGSTGRGTAFSAELFANWGGPDVPDNLAVVDAAVARRLADPDRLLVGGWSYGGMSTNYLIASTTRFKAAVSGASIANVLAGYGTDQYIRDYDHELGHPWKNPDTWRRVSYPFFHADRIKTPTLFLCGEKDFNVPLLASEQMYQALRSLGVPTQLVIYPGQFHGLTKPSYILDRHQRHLAWYARWLGDNK